MRTRIALHAPVPEGLLCPDCGATVNVKRREDFDAHACSCDRGCSSQCSSLYFSFGAVD
jgi:hypothetical protein